MEKTSTQILFVCAHCDAQFPKWTGRCTVCGKWGTIASGAGVVAEANVPRSTGSVLKVAVLSSIEGGDAPRTRTGIEEVDRVLGGGIVAGGVMIFGGEPGIGKSTLVLQIAAALATDAKRVLYISGEESGAQIRMRMERMGIKNDQIDFLADTRVEHIIATIIDRKPALAIVDSIQTMGSMDADGATGGVTQIKAVTAQLTECAKHHNIPLLLIGHVNKEGGVAGPKTLEHLVDAVFMLEGDRSGEVRMLRAIKNRFGAVAELGVFIMKQSGLEEVKNPSELFLAERSYQVPGTTVTPIMEGTRPLLVEVQALVTRTLFGTPARRASGIDVNRLQILIAVLSRRLQLPLDSHDVFVNVSGGAIIRERSADLAVAMAIMSALQNTSISKDIIAFGEIGLGGEVRSVPNFEARIKEAEKLGFTYALVPAKHPTVSTTLKVAPVKNVEELVDKILKS